jgi:glycosyltransferase involved in cell wall biosynthesis
MQAADCLVCPSLWAEAAGLVILEAMACGLPVVASRIGGIPEFVLDGTSGLLFAAGNSRELAHRLNWLLSDEAARERLGQTARLIAVERYSSQNRIPDQIRLYA